MIRRIFLWCQVVFSAMLLLWSSLMCIGCIFSDAHRFYVVVLALLAVLAYKLLEVTRSELKGGGL